MLRIIAGKFRSRLINTPESFSTRPTKDRVREAIFSAIGQAIAGAHVLDLFSGSGALAFESMSRGAKHITCIDNHLEAFTILKHNKTLLALTDEECVIAFGDFKKHIKSFAEKGVQFDIIFLDPPYGHSLEVKAFQLLLEQGILNDNGIIVVESDQIPQMENPIFIKTKTYDYGSTKVKIYWRST
jgi:16S rRNA (guanine(966)-N(2))-methyltransferase RsmD